MASVTVCETAWRRWSGFGDPPDRLLPLNNELQLSCTFVDPSDTHPTNPAPGTTYYNTATQDVHMWNGRQWLTLAVK